MKKLLTIAICSLTIFNTFSQEAGDKKIQAGLVFSTGMNTMQPGTKLIVKNGLGSELIVGMNFNYSLNKSLAFNTGIEFDFSTIKFKSNQPLYYFYNDTEIIRKGEYLTTNENGSANYNPSGTMFQLNERKQKPIYLTIPTMLMFRTNFIGYFRYFGKFGLRNSFLLSNKIYDNGYIVGNPGLVDNNAMHTTSRELSIYKGAIGMCGGAEWNFSGATCLVAELGYYYGFIDVNRGKSVVGDKEKNMSTINSINEYIVPTAFSNLPFKQNQILLKVSILF